MKERLKSTILRLAAMHIVCSFVFLHLTCDQHGAFGFKLLSSGQSDRLEACPD